MAGNIDDGELWFPSEFLPGDFFSEQDVGSREERRPSADDATTHGHCEFGSDLNFMGQSVTEAEGNEENYIAGLTLQMAHSFLQDDDDESYTKAFAAGSPQSTLYGAGSCWGSNKGSPNGPSQASSPPSTPLVPQTGDADAWDLLPAAAGEAVRLSLSDKEQQPKKPHERGLPAPPAKPSHPVPVPPKNPVTGFPATPLTSQHPQQLQAERFYQLTQQQLMKQQSPAARGRQHGIRQGMRCGPPLGFHSSEEWPPLQRQLQYPKSGSGMRVVFLSGPDTKRVSAGTGVFLPRNPEDPTELRKKPAGTTVLLPDRVVQALNLNLDAMRAPQRLPTRLPLHHVLDDRRSALPAQQKRNRRRRSPPTSAVANAELRLPDEWTY